MDGEFGRRGVVSLALNFSQRRRSGIARMCQLRPDAHSFFAISSSLTSGSPFDDIEVQHFFTILMRAQTLERRGLAMSGLRWKTNYPIVT